MKKIYWVLLLVTTALVAFFVYSLIPPAKPSDLSNVVIALERTACFGYCPVYEVTVFGNGTLVFQGKSNVNLTGTQVLVVDTEDVAKLVDEFYKVDFFSLKSSKRQFDDSPGWTTTITINGRTKRVSGTGSPNIYNFNVMINELANTDERIEQGKLIREKELAKRKEDTT